MVNTLIRVIIFITAIMAVFIKRQIKGIQLLSAIVMLYGCFPSFAPEVMVKREIRKDDVTVRWIGLKGILDQDFPDYISIQKGELIDTVCQSHNIANLLLIRDTIRIAFYGNPEQYYEPITIPEMVLGYTIIIDTTWTKELIR